MERSTQTDQTTMFHTNEIFDECRYSCCVLFKKVIFEQYYTPFLYFVLTVNKFEK